MSTSTRVSRSSPSNSSKTTGTWSPARPRLATAPASSPSTTPPCHHRLRQHAEQQEPGHHDSGYVFTGLGGDPLAPDRLTRHFRALAAAAGLPPIRLHDLRHGAATIALAAGVELKVVQDMMGHASIVLTADTYTSVLPEVARTAAEQVASLILKAGRLIPGTTRARRSPGRRKRKPRSAPPARLPLAHPTRRITLPPAPGHQPSLNPLAKA